MSTTKRRKPRKARAKKVVIAYHVVGSRLWDHTKRPRVGERRRLPRGVPARICSSGYHACRTPVQAFDKRALVHGVRIYLTQVRVRDISAERSDKFVARERTILAMLHWSKAQKLFGDAWAMSSNYTEARRRFNTLVKAEFKRIRRGRS